MVNHTRHRMTLSGTSQTTTIKVGARVTDGGEFDTWFRMVHRHDSFIKSCMARGRGRSRKGSRSAKRKPTVVENKLTLPKLAKVLCPDKKAVWLRNGTIQSAQNEIRYYFLPGIFDRALTNTTSSISAGVSGALPSLINLAGITTSESGAPGYDWKISNVLQRVSLRNVSNHTAIVRIYECQARQDIRQSPSFTSGPPILTNTQVYGAEDLFLGWDLITGTVEATAVGTGTIVKYNTGQEYVDMVGDLSIFDSTNFVKNYKIVKTYKQIMPPSANLFVKMSTKGRQFDGYWDATGNTGEEQIQIYADSSKFFLVQVTGVLGKATDNDAIVGAMTTDIAWDLKQTWNYYPVIQYKKSVAHRLNDRTNITGKTLEGPSDFSIASENQ